MESKQVHITSLKKGGYVIINNAPCVVKDIQIGKTGKHGHAKCRIEAVGLIDHQKRVIVRPGHDKIDVPIIEKKNAQVLSIQGNKANVMDMETYETFEVEIPEELKDDIKEGSQVIYWLIMGSKVIQQVK